MPKEQPGPDVLRCWKDGDEEAKSEVWEWINGYSPGKIYRTCRRADVIAFDFDRETVEEIVLRALDDLLGYIEKRLQNERDFELASPFALLVFWDRRITDGVRREIRRRDPRPPPRQRKVSRQPSSKRTKVIGDLGLMCHELQNDPRAYKAFRDRWLVSKPAMQILFDAWWRTLQETSVEGLIESLMDTLNWPRNKLDVYNRRLLQEWRKFSGS